MSHCSCMPVGMTSNTDMCKERSKVRSFVQKHAKATVDHTTDVSVLTLACLLQKEFQRGTQRALRDRLMSRGKNCLPTVSRQFLTRNYPRPNCLLKCLPNCLSPTREGFLSSFKINPAVRVIARQVRDRNCLAAIFAPRHQSVSSGPLGSVARKSPGNFRGSSGKLWEVQAKFQKLWEVRLQPSEMQKLPPIFFERGGKTPTPKISALLRKRPVLLRANFVLTKDRKRPYYGHFCGKIHREGSCSKAAGGP